MISATVVADSVSPHGHRIATLEVVIPRIVLAEFNTHRVFSRNSASSRAIPIGRMLESVKEHPFVPYAWQKEHTGMQGSDYIKDPRKIERLNQDWLLASDHAIRMAREIAVVEQATKQLANRLLEPFMYHRVLVTSTEWDNFLNLRCPRYTAKNGEWYRSRKDYIADAQFSIEDMPIPTDLIGWLEINKGAAEIHVTLAAEAIHDALNESAPKMLKEGEWHVPYADKMDKLLLVDFCGENGIVAYEEVLKSLELKVSCGMAARTSYTTIEGAKDLSYSSLIGIHDRHVDADPPHSSIYEHCNQAMNDKQYNLFSRTYVNAENNQVIEKGWCNNVRGFIQYRHNIDQNRLFWETNKIIDLSKEL
jgi:thymidylate synthase ThyX